MVVGGGRGLGGFEGLFCGVGDVGVVGFGVR